MPFSRMRRSARSHRWLQFVRPDGAQPFHQVRPVRTKGDPVARRLLVDRAVAERGLIQIQHQGSSPFAARDADSMDEGQRKSRVMGKIGFFSSWGGSAGPGGGGDTTKRSILRSLASRHGPALCVNPAIGRTKVVSAAPHGLAIPGVDEVKGQRCVHGNGRMQGRRKHARAVANSGDRLSRLIDCMQRHPSSIACDE